MKKKGYIRTLEAVIAIVIILVFVFTVMQPRYRKERESGEIELLQDVIINELEENDDYREDIIGCDPGNCDLTDINEFIEDTTLAVGVYRYYLHIQPVDAPLKIPENLPENKKIYARGIIMSATLEEGYAPKIVVLYLWEE